MKNLFLITIVFILCLPNVYSANFTVNGTPYNGQKFKVYPNSESLFEVRFSEGNISRTESSNPSFITRSEVLSQQSQNGMSISDGRSAKVFVKANSGTRLNSTSNITLMPMLTVSGQTFPFFEVILSPLPSIKNIELMTADIKNLQKGLPIRIIVNGSGLDDIDLNLPKGINAKNIKTSDSEMTIELSSKSKSYKGVVIDNKSFEIRSSKDKIKFEAKKLDFGSIK